MKHRSIDIFVVIAVTLVAITLVFTVRSDNVPVRILALPLVLVLPGYALTSALFVGQAFGIIERLVFSLGISLVIVISGGLLLDVTPFGLGSDSWAVLLGGITLAASIVTLVRRRRQNVSAPHWWGSKGIGLTFRQGLLLGMAAAIVCAAIAVSIIGAERQSYPGFTQLWILPVSGATRKDTVLLGVRNMEKAAMEYHLRVKVDGKLVKRWPAIDLKPGEKWEAALVILPAKHVGSTEVEAVLYRADDPTTIYRHVVLWLGT